MTLGPPTCSKCGYDLSGLGRAGRCPECGNVFNLLSGRGVRSVSEQMARGDRLIRRARTIALVLLGLMMVACGGWIQWLRAGGRSLWIAAFFAAMAFLAAVVSYVYEKDEEY